MQKNNLKVETEGKEIAIRNSHGDIAIIPIKDAGRIKSLLNDGCNTCIDEYVKSLPSASQYAQDGGVYPKVETTKLNPAEESSYQTWRTKLPKNLQYEDDYDLRGFYKENPKFDVNDPSQHLTDKYKLPNHPTFSNESMYYKGNENYGGTWKSYDYGDIYTPNNPETKQSKVEWRRGFDSKDKVVVNGKLMDIKSPEYKEAYSKGIGYFDSRGVFITSKETLPEVVIKSKIAKDSYADYKNQFLKTNPSDKFYSQRESEHNEEFYSAPLWAQQQNKSKQ